MTFISALWQLLAYLVSFQTSLNAAGKSHVLNNYTYLKLMPL